jgi:hypothetical protein
VDDDTKHIWLYAKDIYPHSADLWVDMRKVIGEICGLPPELVGEWEVIYHLTGIAFDIINEPGGNPRGAFMNFIQQMRAYASGGFGRACVEACLATIKLAKPPRHISAEDVNLRLWWSLKGEEPHAPEEV